MRTRKAVNLLAWDDDLKWYARAVAKMKQRPMDDPTSWKFQAAIHGYPLPDDQRISPFAKGWWKTWVQNEPLPSPEQQEQFWDRCQHGSWFFLPWHRMYLGYFEKMVLDIIVKLGGPGDWALPYWNYRASDPNSLKLPWAFYQTQMEDKSANALFEPARGAGNDGKPAVPPDWVDLSDAFNEDIFIGGINQIPTGFGGPRTIFEHHGGDHGQLEAMPHDLVHVAIGNGSGLMGDPGTAGYDPIFWLHHANIDRLWAAWLNLNHQNPTDSAWLRATAADFYFNDGSNNIPKLTPADVLDTKTGPFYYQYDDLSVSFTPTGAPPAPLRDNLMAETPVPEMAGASSAALQLTSAPTDMQVRLFPVTGPARQLLSAEGHFRKAYLRLENIRGTGQPSPYAVYLNVPEGADHRKYEPLRVGSIPTFGLAEASLASRRHPGNGLNFVLNVTRTVRLLQAENLWHPERLKVTFVPARNLKEGEQIEVGRVSLHYV